MNLTYYLDGKPYTFETQEELDTWLANNPGASETNDKVDFKPSTDFNVNTESFSFEPITSRQDGNIAKEKEISILNGKTEENKEQLYEEFKTTYQTDNPDEVIANVLGNDVFAEQNEMVQSSDFPDLPEGFMFGDYDFSNTNSMEGPREIVVQKGADNNRTSYESKFAVSEDADKEIIQSGDNYLNFEDLEVSLLRQQGKVDQADAKAKELGYVQLFDKKGNATGWVPKDVEDKAQEKANHTTKEVLEEERRNLYHRLVSTVNIAYDNSASDENMASKNKSRYIDTFGSVDFASGLRSRVLGYDPEVFKALKDFKTVIESGEIGDVKLKPLPASTASARAYNDALKEFVTLNRALQVNANLNLLEEENYFKEIVSSKNDQTVESFSGIMNSVGFEVDPESSEREGSFYGREVLEGGRDVAAHLVPLVASIYLTKKIPIGGGAKVKNLGNVIDKAFGGVARWSKALGPQSRIFQGAIDLTIGGLKETVILGLADIPAEKIFGADPFVYNDATGEFSPGFPFFLGVGNTAAAKVIKKLNNTKNIFTPALSRISKYKSSQALLEANIGATVGTATMYFAENVVGLSNWQNFGYESEDEMKEEHGFQNLLETYVGMLMFQSVSPNLKANSLSKFASGMRSDILRARTGLSTQARKAAKSFNVETDSKGEFNLTEINKVKNKKLFNLNKQQKDKSIVGFEAEIKAEKIKVEQEYERLVFHNELKLAKKLAKKEGVYRKSLDNTFDIFNRMKSGQKETAKDVERIAELTEVELKFLKQRFEVGENSSFSAMINQKSETYKFITKTVAEKRLNRLSPELREAAIQEYLNQAEILGEISNLKAEAVSTPHLKNINKKKIKLLEEKLDLSTENLIKNEKVYDKLLKSKFETEVEFAKLMAKEIGAGFKVLSEKEYNKLEGVEKGSEGSYNRVNNKIYINKTAALKARQLGTPLHEVTHAILRNSLKETYKTIDGVEKTRVSKEGMVKINKFLSKLNTKERQLVEQRMESEYKYYKETYTYKDKSGKEVEGTRFTLNGKGEKIARPKNEYAEEYLTAFGDVLKNKEVKQSSGLTSRLKSYFEPIFQKYGFKNIDVSANSGEGLYNMIKAIQKSSETGVINKDVLNVIKTSKTVTGKNIAESRTVTKEMEQASKEIDVIYKEKGLEGYNEIIERIKGKDAQGRQVSKDFIKFYTEIYRDHAKYSELKEDLYREMAMDPVYGVLGSIIKYQPAKNASIASHILGRLKQGKHIDVANKILGKDAARQFTKSLDVAEAKEIEANQLTAEELLDIQLAKEKIQQAPNFRKSIVKGEEKGINKELIDKVESTVLKTFGTKLPLPNTKGFEKSLENNFKTELKKPIADLMGKGPEYEVFLRDNFDQIMKFVDNRFFVQIERLSKPKDRIFTEVENESMSVKETDKAISEGRVPKNTSRTSGQALYKFKKPTPAEFMKFYTGRGLGSTKGTRKDRLAEVIGIELAKDMTSQVLSKPEVVAKVKDISLLELERSIEGIGKESRKVIEAREMMFDTYLERVASEIGRDPNLMFSVTEIKRDARELKKLLKDSDVRNVFDLVKRNALVQRKDGTSFHPKAVDIVFYQWQIGNLRDNILKQFGKGNLGYNYEPFLQAQSKGKISRLRDSGIKIEGGVGEKSVYYKPEGDWKGGTVQQADMRATFYGTGQMWELKLDKAQGSRNPAGFVNYTKGTITRSKKRADAKEEALVVESMQKAIKNGAKQVEAVLRDQGILKKGEDFTSQTKIPLEIHDILSGRGSAKAKLADVSVKVDGKFIEGDYLKKGVFNFQIGGTGAFVLGKPSANNRIAMEAGATRLEGNFELKSRLYATSYKATSGPKVKNSKGEMVYPTAGYTYKLSATALISPKNITSKTTLDLDASNAWKKMAETPYAKKLKKAFEGEQRALKANNKKAPSLLNSKTNSEFREKAKTFDKALTLGRKKNKKARGMSTFDFDETVGISENFVFATKNGKKKKIASNEWPFVGDKLLAEGWKMDFTDFNKVTKGKPGPLMQKMKNQIKKYGPENVFILTARAPESQKAIHDYLKSEGIEIPLENVTGLGNSTGEAKAMWMLKKFSEGYNDMYFVDDALPNVKAVKEVLNQLDIKSNVQQALMSSKTNINKNVNDILKHSLGIESNKTFSRAEGKFRGKDKKRRKFFMTDSAADLELLLEPLFGKGDKGNKNKKWFGDNYLKVWERGINDLNTARQTITNDYMSLRKQNKDVVKVLDKPVEGTNFTNDAAMRVYVWNKAGLKIPGLAEASKAKLVEHVENNANLQLFAEKVSELTKIETGLKQPTETWWSETIASEISEIGKGVSRKKYLGEWLERSNEIFSAENLNKMEAELGPLWRESMENMLYRMETGSTRNSDMGRIGNNIMTYLNGSVGAIMNLNTRSATLQLISTVNFINHAENNPLMAAKAFANQPQYWKDFMFIMNSDMLKQRRDGLQINVTEAELAAAVNGKKSKAKQALSWILKQGYLPTKIADSFAISSGGATYYRNRINKYIKEGFNKKEAESQAFTDFQAVAERTQQSSRPDLLSKQQVSFEGRLLLPFANTPMQMNRIMIKEYLDISKGRYKGFFGENSFTNKVSKISYYGAIQSAIFAGLQTGLFALMVNSEDDDLIADKQVRAVNTMADSFLRGMGISGVVASGVKNAYLAFMKEDEKGFRGDFSEVSEALLNMSPTIGSKFSKLDGAGNTYKYNKKEIYQKGFSLDNTPLIDVGTQTVEAIFNIPVNRAFRKVNNISAALDEQNEDWQRVMMAAGWSNWDVGIDGKKRTKSKKVKKYDYFQE